MYLKNFPEFLIDALRKGRRKLHEFCGFPALKSIGLFLSLTLLSSACGTEPPRPEDTEHFSPSPIAEIQERLPLSLLESFDRLAAVLSRHGATIPSGLSEDGRFSSSPIKIRDFMCNAQFLRKAPVSCEVRFYGKLRSITENSTLMTLKYREHCAGQTHIPVTCKDSNAERLLFSVHREIKN